MKKEKQQASESTENSATEKKSKKKLVIISSVLSVILIIGIIYFIISANYESTDNAQIDADIVPIKASVSGYVKTIKFKDNEQKKKGDTLIIIDDTDLKTRVAQADAALENAKANLIAMQNNSSASEENANASVLTSASVEQTINTANAR